VKERDASQGDEAMSPPKNPNSDRDSKLCWTQQLAPNQGLAAIKHSGKRQHGCALFQIYEVITKSSL
jgi:hypothetical protein